MYYKIYSTVSKSKFYCWPMHLRTCTYIYTALGSTTASVTNIIVGKNLYQSTNGQRYVARAKVQACVACTHSSRELPLFHLHHTTLLLYNIMLLHAYCIAIVSSNSAPLQWFSVCVYTTPPPFSHSFSPSFHQHCLTTNNSPWISMDGCPFP